MPHKNKTDIEVAPTICVDHRVAEEIGFVGVGDELVVAGEDGGVHVGFYELAALGGVVVVVGVLGVVLADGVDGHGHVRWHLVVFVGLEDVVGDQLLRAL